MSKTYNKVCAVSGKPFVALSPLAKNCYEIRLLFQDMAKHIGVVEMLREKADELRSQGLEPNAIIEVLQKSTVQFVKASHEKSKEIKEAQKKRLRRYSTR